MNVYLQYKIESDLENTVFPFVLGESILSCKYLLAMINNTTSFFSTKYEHIGDIFKDDKVLK